MFSVINKSSNSFMNSGIQIKKRLPNPQEATYSNRWISNGINKSVPSRNSTSHAVGRPIKQTTATVRPRRDMVVHFRQPVSPSDLSIRYTGLPKICRNRREPEA